MMPLTDEQHAVVHHPADRHATVLAVAGAGKTTTMVHRIRHLLTAGGVAPARIRAVMFNRAARADFELKLAALGVPTGARGVRVQTFHAVGLDIVRWAEGAGLLAERREVLEADAEQRLVLAAVQQVQRAAGLGKQADGLEAEEVANAIRAWKGMLTPPERAIHHENPLIAQAFSVFEGLRQRAGRLTFDDLIAEAVHLIEGRPEARAALVDRLDHLIIDEFQDVNYANQHLARLLAGQRARVMVVGDDDQCIYEWRGARSAYIKGAFHGPTSAHDRYTLSHTFRFGPAIAQAAARVVARNIDRVEKGLRAHDPQRPGRVTVETAEPKEQVDRIVALLADGAPLPEIIVLVRSYAQSYPLQAALLARDLPFFVDDGQRLFVDTWPVRVQRAYLALVAGLDRALDAELEAALSLVVNVPGRYVPGEPFRVSTARAVARKARLVDFLEQQRVLYPHLGGLVAALGQAVRPTAHAAWTALDQSIDFSNAFRQFLPIGVAVEHGLRQAAFATLLQARATPLAEVEALVAGLDTRRGQPAAACLRITSIFKAKGLEWDHVILPRVVEGLLPSLRPLADEAGDRAHPERSQGQTAAIEAERRLFYVALTRARVSVQIFTDGGERDAPSRFVEEAGLTAATPALKALNQPTGVAASTRTHSLSPPLPPSRPAKAERAAPPPTAPVADVTPKKRRTAKASDSRLTPAPVDRATAPPDTPAMAKRAPRRSRP